MSLKKSYGFDLYGEMKLESPGSIPSWSASEERRILYYDGKMYVATDSEWKERSGSSHKYITFNYEGVCQDEATVIDGFYFDVDVTVKKITLFASIMPTGSNLTVDLLKDGVQQSRVATLTASNNYERTDITDIDYDTSERFGIRIKSVGSGEAGQALTVIVHYYDK